MTDDLLHALSDLDPALQAAAEAERLYWEPDRPPRSALAGELARAFSDASIDQEVLRKAFEICEAALVQNHPDADALATGFLEGLQHADGRGAFDFFPVAAFLGPRSREHCQRMDKFHGAKTRGL